RIGLWPRLAGHASDLQVMRIVDAGGKEVAPRLSADFNAADIGERPFGWNLPNWLLRRELLAHLAEQPSVTFLSGVSVTKVTARLADAVVRLSNGTQAKTRLLVGADGRDSVVRGGLNIGRRRTQYDQKALAFAVTHPEPHNQVSTEIHRSGGPFTLVPLPDHDGGPCSAVVWMERPARADALATMDEAEFNAEATARSCGLFGPLKLATRRTVWPMIAQVADRFCGPRTALMAEAAHVVPPIGAQGLNMSLGDLGALLDLMGDDASKLGDASLLKRYDRMRRPEVTARVLGVDMLNRFSMVEAQPLRDLRRTGLQALYGLAPVRRLAMHAGLGARGR
ncbi:MAG: FAD-dependent monooxygenase, partial [Pseudomonadota bacterium]